MALSSFCRLILETTSNEGMPVFYQIQPPPLVSGESVDGWAALALPGQLADSNHPLAARALDAALVEDPGRGKQGGLAVSIDSRLRAQRVPLKGPLKAHRKLHRRGATDRIQQGWGAANHQVEEGRQHPAIDRRCTQAAALLGPDLLDRSHHPVGVWKIDANAEVLQRLASVERLRIASEQLLCRSSDRLDDALGPRAADLWVFTFHSAAALMLRREAERVGLSRSFVIYDDADQLSLVKRAMREAEVELTLISPREVLSRIDQEKNSGRLPSEMTIAPGDYRRKLTQQVYLRYQQLLRAANAVDFGDLLLLLVSLLRKDPEVRTIYHHKIDTSL